jgi:hypothetical protein
MAKKRPKPLAVDAEPGRGFDDRYLRVQLSYAIEVDDYVCYNDAYAYFRDIEDVLADVAKLIGEGVPDAAMSLAEYTLELLSESVGMVDDSDGGLMNVLSIA